MVHSTNSSFGEDDGKDDGAVDGVVVVDVGDRPHVASPFVASVVAAVGYIILSAVWLVRPPMQPSSSPRL